MNSVFNFSLFSKRRAYFSGERPAGCPPLFVLSPKNVWRLCQLPLNSDHLNPGEIGFRYRGSDPVPNIFAPVRYKILAIHEKTTIM